MAIPDIMVGKLSIPVVAAPLFIISNPDLVIAQCKAGIVGSFPSLNARPIEVLDEWLDRITSELKAYDEANPDKPSAPLPSTKSSTDPMTGSTRIWICARSTRYLSSSHP